MSVKLAAAIFNILSVIAAGLFFYPLNSRLRVNYFDEAGNRIESAEYICNYRGITYKEAQRIIGVFKKRGLSESAAAGEIYVGLYADLSRFAAVYGYDAINAEAEFFPEAEERFKYKEGVFGAGLDEKSAIDAIIKSVGKKSVDVTLRVIRYEPEYTEELLREVTKYRASYSTRYPNSKPERKSNIKLAASKLSGAVINPNDVFSFNETVGKRTAERGFLSAPIIFDGQLVEGVGGGVCQVSTTLYNAALYANLEIVHVKRHSSMVGYVPPSFDAMVSELNDLKFKNNTGYPLYLAAHADDDLLNIVFYGKPMEEGLKIKLRSQVNKIIPGTDKVLINDGSYEIPENEKFLRLARSANGCVSEGYADYIKNGTTIKSVKIRSDEYKPMQGLIVMNATKKEELANPSKALPLIREKIGGCFTL
ncbi:MAG: VanW family protein [Clostridiales bacterium]|nr:VanW family protein [Clostridiales bacterium]